MKEETNMNIHELYKSKLLSCGELAAKVESGWAIIMDAAISEADGLTAALCARAAEGELQGVKVHTMLDVYPYPFYESNGLDGKINGVSWFSSGGARKAINAGYADFIPNYYRDIPGLIRANYRFDAFFASVAPMDENGKFSLSTVGSYSRAAMEKADRIFLEVNEEQPYVPGGIMIDIKDVDFVCENTHALPVLPPSKLDATSIKIGELIAERIPDGACIQLGIGAIPDAVGNALKVKRDLGIHTEMFTDSMVELINCGAVNNSKKQLHPGKTVTTFAYGSQRIYDLLNGNQDILIMDVDYVNDPNVICRNKNMVSINSCIEVDFWGQVCSESVGTRHMSGSGGQVDYVRGAIQSEGGMSFIAFESTAKGGTISKIKPCLAPGAVVTTSKNDVDCIVTEFGIAKLRGRSLAERTKALIAIAHPDFRDELSFEAKKRGIML